MSIKRTTTISKGFIGAIIASSVLLGASSPIKSTKQETQPAQTELMSKESAEALKANSLQQTPTVPTVHNPKLDATLKKFAINENDLTDFNTFINNTYKNCGTYLGTALLQMQTDVQMLQTLIGRNTNLVIKNNINPSLARKIEGYGDAFFKTITPNKDVINNWIPKYMAVIENNLRFDHKPTAEEVNDRLDFIAKNKMQFTQEELFEYLIYSDDFLRNKIKNNRGIVAASDLLAFKMFMIDRLAFAKTLYGAGVFGRGSFDDNKGHDMRYFYEQWMESVAPKAD